MQGSLALKCIAAWFVAILFLPVYIFVVIILFLWRILISTYCKKIHPNFVRSDDKLVYSLDEKDCTGCVHGCMFVLKGKINAEDFFKTFMEKVIKVKDIRNHQDPHIRFYQSPVEFCGELFFKTYETIIFDNHVDLMTISTDSTRNEALANWIAKPFKTNCPSWAMLFLTVECSAEVTFVFKLHHVLGDGYSLLHIMDLLTNTRYKYRVKNFEDTFKQKIKMIAELPYRFLEFSKEMESLRNERGYFADRHSEHFFITSISLPLEPLQEIRRTDNVHFASVMICLLKMAFFRFILSTKSSVESIVVPLSLPWPNHPKTKLCNYATVAYFRFKMNSEAHCHYKDLQAIESEFKAIHRKYFNRIFKWNLQATGHYPVAVNKLLTNLPGIKTIPTITYAHMFGSENYNRLFGSTIQDVSMFGLIRIPNIWVYGLTTNNEVKLTITGRRTTEFEPEKYGNLIKESLQMLLLSCRESLNEYN